MFFNNNLNDPSCSSRLLELHEDEFEVMRLRKLLQDNILKVEKENFESIQRDLSSQKPSSKEKNICFGAQKSIARNSNVKSSLSLKPKSAPQKVSKCLRGKPFETERDSNLQLPSLPKEHVSQTASSDCPFSHIHFLNHLHSSFISSKPKTSILSCDSKDKYMPCAVPIGPPNQKKSLISLGQTQSSNEKLISNTAVYNVISKEVPKKLTVQALPSISIIGRKPNLSRNILMEVVQEKDCAAGDCIQTTVLPALSEVEKNRISKINLSSSVPTENPSAYTNSSDQFCRPRPKKSVFTGSSSSAYNLKENPEVYSRENIKEIIREALNDFKSTSHQDLNSESKEKEPAVISHQNDCELDSFIGNVDLTPRESGCSINKEITKNSTYTQTNCGEENIAFDRLQMKDLIQEILLENQQITSLNHFRNKQEESFIPEIERVHREIQTERRGSETLQNIKCGIPKEVQVSLISEKPHEIFSDSVVPEYKGTDETGKNHDSMMKKSIPRTVQPSTLSNSLSPTPLVPSEVPTRLETVLNCVYQHLCKDNQGLALNCNPPTLTEAVPTVITREVSVQFNPVFTSTKSTCTSEVMRVDAINQCDTLPHVEKCVKHASIQVVPPVPVIPPEKKVNSSVQCDQPTTESVDACVQTFDSFNIFPHSENSANTSVSSTPVSESMFLDDMLSEGEVFLPWNLRLLSHSDKAALQTSSNVTDANCSSDKEKDYSLSEGEVHPKYFQQANLVYSPSYDSSSDTYYCTTRQSNPYILLPKSPDEFDLTAQFLNPFSGNKCCHCQASSSSISEGEVRNSSTPISEGEIPIPAKQYFQNRPLSLRDFSSTLNITRCQRHLLQQNSIGDPLPPHVLESEISPSNQLSHSNLHISEGEIIEVAEGIREPNQSTYRSLSSVTEKKCFGSPK